MNTEATTEKAMSINNLVNSLSGAERNTIESLKWAMDHFGSLATSRNDRRSTMTKLIERDIAKSVGMVEVCDDNGFIKEGCQKREGFQLTELGIKAHSVIIDW